MSPALLGAAGAGLPYPASLPSVVNCEPTTEGDDYRKLIVILH